MGVVGGGWVDMSICGCVDVWMCVCGVEWSGVERDDYYYMYYSSYY